MKVHFAILELLLTVRQINRQLQLSYWVHFGKRFLSNTL